MNPSRVLLTGLLTLLSLLTLNTGVTDPVTDEHGLVPNTLVNGSFEQHGPLANKTGYFDTIPGWQAVTGQLEIQRGNTQGVHAYQGRDKLELDAFFNSAIYQAVQVEPGRYYSLDLHYSPRKTQNGTDSNDIELWWNGGLLRTLSGDRKDWQTHHLDVWADNDNDTAYLALRAAGRSDGKGGLLDAFSLTPTPYTSANLIRNPSFEQHGPLNHNQWGRFKQIPHWQATQGKIELHRHTHGGRRAAEGIIKLALDSNAHSRIEQSIATEAGRHYRLSLAYASRKNQGNSDEIKLFWNNQLLATLKGNRGSWRRYRFDVLAEQSSSQLAIRGAGKIDNLGGHLDDIRLHRLPYTDVNQIVNGSFEPCLSGCLPKQQLLK